MSNPISLRYYRSLSIDGLNDRITYYAGKTSLDEMSPALWQSFAALIQACMDRSAEFPGERTIALMGRVDQLVSVTSAARLQEGI